MNAKQTHQPADDEMPAEIDFSKGVRGKFYRAGARMVLPVHLDADVANALTHSAEEEGVDVNAFVAKLLDEHREAAKQEATPRARP
jgi:hypothetical protein